MAAVSEREYKKCPCCGKDKWLDEFYVNPKTGYRDYCLDCRRTKSKTSGRRRQTHKREEYNAYMRGYMPDWEKEKPKTPRSRLLSDL